MTVSRSGQIRSPHTLKSSPVLPTMVIRSGGMTRLSPTRNFEAPTPPASTTTPSELTLPPSLRPMPDRHPCRVLRPAHHSSPHFSPGRRIQNESPIIVSNVLVRLGCLAVTHCAGLAGLSEGSVSATQAGTAERRGVLRMVGLRVTVRPRETGSCAPGAVC